MDTRPLTEAWYPSPAPADDTAVRCQHCGASIGYYTNNAGDGRVWLCIGAVRLQSASGRCVICGAEWHWMASTRKLHELVELIAGNV